MDTSYLSQQVTTIIGQLHNLFDEIGVPHHERDSRESELFSSLSETLHNHLRIVSSEKNEMLEQAKNIIKTIKQMEQSLEDQKGPHYASNSEDLSVSYPLNECLKGLKEKHRQLSKLHHERCEQVQKLVQALESYSSHLEPSFIKIKLPQKSADGTFPPTFDISPSYINSVDNEFARVYEEYTRRVTLVQQLAQEIIKYWAELGTPQAQTDSSLVRYWQDSPEQIGLHQDDVNKLKGKRDRLQEEKKGRERKLKDLRTSVESLWDRLQIGEAERKAFQARSRGCGLRTINDLEDELERLNELKRQNLHLFVEDCRTRLHALWDELYFSEEEAVEFTPMFCDVYSDALLSAHEAEVARLEALKEQRAPTLAMIEKHRSILKDKDELANSSQDASRLIAKKGERRDPTRLLREEKMRKRIARELPKVEKDLAKVLESFEDEYGRPFLVFGERYLDAISAPSGVSSSKPPTARSKTPVGSGPAPKSAKSASQPQRVNAGARDAGTVRSKTPADTGTVSRTALPPSRGGGAASKSPSRIPARAPLGTMPHGGNSPERKQHAPPQSAREKENVTRGKLGAPLMAPPPKMRDLQSHAQDTSTPSTAYHNDDVFRSGDLVRSRMPEDPYGHPRPPPHSQNSGTTDHGMPPPPRPQNPRPGPHEYAYPQSYAPSQYTASEHSATSSVMTGSRQTSNTSYSSNPSNSASENWESYASSEDSEDADRTRIGTQAGSKRGYEQYGGSFAAGTIRANPATKKPRPGMPPGMSVKGPVETIAGHGGDVASERPMVEGSDAGWTDDDVY